MKIENTEILFKNTCLEHSIEIEGIKIFWGEYGASKENTEDLGPYLLKSIIPANKEERIALISSTLDNYGYWYDAKRERIYFYDDCSLVLAGGNVCKSTKIGRLTERRKILFAHLLFIGRRLRYSHPKGEFDKARRWEPSENEKSDCCSHIRKPSARWPYSLMVHCRTAEHIASLCGVTTKEVKAIPNLPAPKKTSKKTISSFLESMEEVLFE